MKTVIVTMCVLLSGCAYSIAEIDISHADKVCVREKCLAQYSTCAAGGPVIGAKTETLRACQEAYQICISTCSN